jgi:hypothetical protein
VLGLCGWNLAKPNSRAPVWSAGNENHSRAFECRLRAHETSMTPESFSEQLLKFGARSNAVKWARSALNFLEGLSRVELVALLRTCVLLKANPWSLQVIFRNELYPGPFESCLDIPERSN